MTTKTLIPAALAAAALAAAGCGGNTKPSTADTYAAKAADEAKTQTTTSTTATLPTAQRVSPGPGEGDLKTKPTIPAQTGAAPTRLVVQDVIVGTGPQAKSGDQVSVQYVGVLFKGGKEFDSSWKRKQPFDFSIGAGNVIQGWDQGVAGMRVGGRRRLIVPASLGYGAQGSPPAIPANAALVFDIDLLKVNGKTS
jgi:peptidylprolyl isomerase